MQKSNFSYTTKIICDKLHNLYQKIQKLLQVNVMKNKIIQKVEKIKLFQIFKCSNCKMPKCKREKFNM